ncbi:hypothetical protein PR048_019830 [Dryococelus australis]|uniref:Uncharacterized protein n=1 Tax=Dryococelus australis TaxID=614101 RepID=A0ABQ9H4K5_9NEOP|nr:hypothetical protein PR048_019830 [Dryococelus australis]
MTAFGRHAMGSLCATDEYLFDLQYAMSVEIPDFWRNDGPCLVSLAPQRWDPSSLPQSLAYAADMLEAAAVTHYIQIKHADAPIRIFKETALKNCELWRVTVFICLPPTKGNQVEFLAGSRRSSHVGHLTDIAVGQRVFLRHSSFSCPGIPPLLHLHRGPSSVHSGQTTRLPPKQTGFNSWQGHMWK